MITPSFRDWHRRFRNLEDEDVIYQVLDFEDEDEQLDSDYIEPRKKIKSKLEALIFHLSAELQRKFSDEEGCFIIRLFRENDDFDEDSDEDSYRRGDEKIRYRVYNREEEKLKGSYFEPYGHKDSILESLLYHLHKKLESQYSNKKGRFIVHLGTGYARPYYD